MKRAKTSSNYIECVYRSCNRKSEYKNKIEEKKRMQELENSFLDEKNK